MSIASLAVPVPPCPWQYSVHRPSTYIQQHYPQLLPTWVAAPQSVLIVLQWTSQPLCDHQSDLRATKDRLRSQFLAMAARLLDALTQEGWCSDGFDPRTGYPLRSPAGSQPLDDAAVVQACLGYAEQWCDNCRVILHPDWCDAVYPSVLVSLAPPTVLWQYADRYLQIERTAAMLL